MYIFRTSVRVNYVWIKEYKTSVKTRRIITSDRREERDYYRLYRTKNSERKKKKKWWIFFLWRLKSFILPKLKTGTTTPIVVRSSPCRSYLDQSNSYTPLLDPNFFHLKNMYKCNVQGPETLNVKTNRTSR